MQPQRRKKTFNFFIEARHVVGLLRSVALGSGVDYYDAAGVADPWGHKPNYSLNLMASSICDATPLWVVLCRSLRAYLYI